MHATCLMGWGALVTCSWRLCAAYMQNFGGLDLLNTTSPATYSRFNTLHYFSESSLWRQVATLASSACSSPCKTGHTLSHCWYGIQLQMIIITRINLYPAGYTQYNYNTYIMPFSVCCVVEIMHKWINWALNKSHFLQQVLRHLGVLCLLWRQHQHQQNVASTKQLVDQQATTEQLVDQQTTRHATGHQQTHNYAYSSAAE